MAITRASIPDHLKPGVKFMSGQSRYAKSRDQMKAGGKKKSGGKKNPAETVNIGSGSADKARSAIMSRHERLKSI